VELSPEEREIEWYSCSADEINRTVRRSLSLDGSSTPVLVAGPTGRLGPIDVYAPAKYGRAIQRRFLPAQTEPAISSLYFLGTDLIDDLQSRFKSASPGIGLCADGWRTFLVSGSNSFGLLKSVVTGVASLGAIEQDAFPAHACVFTVAGCGVLISGAHGAGKTSCLYEILSRTTESDEPAVTTDDWVFCDAKDGMLFGRCAEQLVSLDPYLPLARPEFEQRLSALRARYQLPGTSARYAPAAEVFPHCKPATKTRIKKVFILNSGPHDRWLTEISAATAAQAITTSACHLPCDRSLVEKEMNFWNAALQGIPTYRLDIRGKELTRKHVFDDLLAVIRAPDSGLGPSGE
jgi:hypothetical protein